jgi:hypothetical protein
MGFNAFPSEAAIACHWWLGPIPSETVWYSEVVFASVVKRSFGYAPARVAVDRYTKGRVAQLAEQLTLNQ